METPFEYVGMGETCIGCADIIRAGDTVAPSSDDRPDQMLCVACWWLRACDLPLPGWTRGTSGRTNLAGVFMKAASEPYSELEAMIPPLPRLDTNPMPPMTQVPPGPETARPALAEAGEPEGLTLEEAADEAGGRLSEGRKP